MYIYIPKSRPSLPIVDLIPPSLRHCTAMHGLLPLEVVLRWVNPSLCACVALEWSSGYNNTY